MTIHPAREGCCGSTRWTMHRNVVALADEEYDAVGHGRDRVEDTLVRVFFGVDYAF